MAKAVRETHLTTATQVAWLAAGSENLVKYVARGCPLGRCVIELRV